MDYNHFDALTRGLGSALSRRRLGRVVGGGGLGALLGSALGALRLTDAEAAKNKKNKRKRRKRKRQTPVVDMPTFELPPLVFNQYGCIEVGQACRGDSALCCSGICEGAAPTSTDQPDTSRCVAHGTGTCKQGAEGLCTSPYPALATCNNRSDCLCFRTTTGSNFCADWGGDWKCAACQRDVDCVALGFPPNSACLPVSEGICAGICAGGMVCAPPCGSTPSGP